MIGDDALHTMFAVNDPVGPLYFTDISDDIAGLYRVHLALRRHIAKRPMVLFNAAIDSAVDGLIAVVTGIVYVVNQRRTLVGPRPICAMAGRTVFIEGYAAASGLSDQGRYSDIDSLHSRRA